MNYKKIQTVLSLLIATFVTLISVLLLITSQPTLDQKFTQQAISFTHGKLDVPVGGDAAYYQGKYYWPQGPFPSIIMIPALLIFGQSIDQVFMQFILLFFLAFIVYQLAKHYDFSKLDSFYLMYAFLFSSIIIGLIVDAGNVYYSQIVAITLLSTILLEFLTKKRWFVLGVLTGFLVMTRPTSSMIMILLIYYLFNNKENKIYSFILFLFPIFISISLLLAFNYLRFNNFLDNGYYSNFVGEALIPFREKGIFSIHHIPTNFYYYFLTTFRPVTNSIYESIFPYLTFNPWGISFFIVSPFFVYTFRTLISNHTLTKLLWIVVVITLIVILSYYAPGWVQFGPRYMGDLLPVLFMILLISFKKPVLTIFQKNLILISSLINCLLLLSKYFLSLNGSYSYY